MDFYNRVKEFMEHNLDSIYIPGGYMYYNEGPLNINIERNGRKEVTIFYNSKLVFRASTEGVIDFSEGEWRTFVDNLIKIKKENSNNTIQERLDSLEEAFKESIIEIPSNVSPKKSKKTLANTLPPFPLEEKN